MRKIRKDALVISHFGFDNYGNRLQNYAVLHILEGFGVSAVAAAPVERPVRQGLKELVKLVIPRRLWRKKARYLLFRKFARDYTPCVRMPAKRLTRVAASFRCAIVGSDQVWSPYFIGTRKSPESYFLEGISGKRKVALAPSFGVSEIPLQLRHLYAKGIDSFERLSVREKAGADIIRLLTGRDAEVLADPTIAVLPEHWREVARYDACPDHAYVLTYYLGSGDDVVESQVRAFASGVGANVVSVMGEKDAVGPIGPAEFLALIDKAEYLITDSFHGTVFATIMKTPFCVVRRIDHLDRDMFSRLETLLGKLGCSDRVLEVGSSALPCIDMDWDVVGENIARERESILRYLGEELERCGLL